MNLKRLPTKAERMRAYAERHKRKGRPGLDVKRGPSASRLPTCVGLQALADVWGATARSK